MLDLEKENQTTNCEGQLVDDGIADEADTDDDHLCELQTSEMRKEENYKDGQGGKNGRRLWLKRF